MNSVKVKSIRTNLNGSITKDDKKIAYYLVWFDQRTLTIVLNSNSFKFMIGNNFFEWNKSRYKKIKKVTLIFLQN